jgi:L-histidine Nalpha-methyltransferase
MTGIQKMSTTTSPRFTVHQLETSAEVSSFAEDVRHGLGNRPKSLQPKYFYDVLGSHLFEAICHLPEYYPTVAEAEILQRRGAEIIEAAGLPEIVIELGSGSSTKTRYLLEPLLERRSSVHYLPIDISPSVLERSSRELTQKYSRLRVSALAGDFRSALAHLAEIGVERKKKERLLVLFLGSTIGNLEPPSSRVLMKRVRNLLEPGDVFLLGADLKKSEKVLIPAYDDALGVTAAFNLNLLVRINRELGGTFDLRKFRHRAIYNAEAGRIEMHLVSQVAHSVTIRQLGMTVAFEEGETIHTESSHKYDPAQLAVLARDCGFVHTRTWLDSGERFGVHLMSAA